MNAYKSVFVSVWLAFLAMGSARVGYQLLSSPSAWTWWIVALAVLPGLLYFVWLYVFPVARTHRFPLAVFALACAAVLLLAITQETHHEPWSWVLGVGVLGSGLYHWWYADLGRRQASLLQPGQLLPALTFQHADGNPFNTADLSKPLLLLFYRGNWCPLCMAQIREIAAQYQALRALGIEVLLISPQSHGHTQALAQQFQVPMTFLVDYHNAMAKLLGIVHVRGLPAGLEALGYDSDTVMPTVIATDAAGKILYSDLTSDYRIRPEPAAFLSVFRRNALGD